MPKKRIIQSIFMKDEKRVRMIFGDGNIAISAGNEINGGLINILILSTMKEPKLPIGKLMPELIGLRSIEIGESIELEFKNSKSVQVVIDTLEIIKRKLKKKGW